MANIPTIPGTSQVPDVQIGAKRNPQPRIQALAGVRRVAQAAEGSIDSAMSAVADYEEKKRRMQEGAFFNDASLVMMKATADYTSQLKGMKADDIPRQWASISQGVKETIKAKDDIKKLSPNALKLLDLKMNMWQGKTSGHFEEFAGKKAVTEAQASAHATSQEALKTGSPEMMDAAKGAIDIAVKTGAWTPAQGRLVTDQFPMVLERNQILNGIDNDAFATLKKIDAGGYTKVTEKELGTLRNAAEKQVNFVQRTTASDAINDFATSGIPKTKEELRQLKDTGKVTGEFVRGYNAMVERSDYKDAENKQILLMNRLRDLDLIDSDNPQKDVREITDEAGSLPPKLQTAIHKLAALRIKAMQSGNEEEPKNQREAIEQLRHESAAAINSREAIDRHEGRYVLPDEEITARGGNPKDRIGFSESQKLVAAKQEDQLRQWFKDYAAAHQNKQPTPEDVSNERMRILKPSVTDMVKRALARPPTQ